MEKRRRERINKSLNDLKQILLEALRRDVSILLFKSQAAIINFLVYWSGKKIFYIWPTPY